MTTKACALVLSATLGFIRAARVQDENEGNLTATLTEEGPEDHERICGYLKPTDCNSYYSNPKSAWDGKTFKEVCEKLCASSNGRTPQPLKPGTNTNMGGGRPTGTNTGGGNLNLGGGNGNFKDTSGCPAPPECIVGGYTSTVRPKTTWDICSGCWEETCVRNVDMTAEAQLFRANDFDSAYQAALGVLKKVYPAAAEMWEFQKQKVAETGMQHYLQGVKKFLSLRNSDEALQVNVPVHENLHVHHSTTNTYQPTNEYHKFEIKVPTEKNPFAGTDGQYDFNPSHAWTWGFPARMEIWHLIPEDIQKQYQGPSYFKKPDPSKSVQEICGKYEAGPLGCQRITGIMTETEAYTTGTMASSFMNYGVGSDNKWTPNIKHNGYNEGAPFPIAFWSYANVLYLQETKRKYPETWKNLLGQGSVDWTDTAKLFLAHIDRCSYIMRLFLDKNHMERPMVSEAQRCRKLQQEALQKDDVVKELRSAMSSCKR